MTARVPSPLHAALALGLAAASPAAAQTEAPATRHAEAELGEVTLHHVTACTGSAIVLLHGFPQTWAEWRPVILALSESFSVVAPDLRGLGDSSRPDAGHDKAAAAGDIAALM